MYPQSHGTPRYILSSVRPEIKQVLRHEELINFRKIRSFLTLMKVWLIHNRRNTELGKILSREINKKMKTFSHEVKKKKNYVLCLVGYWTTKCTRFQCGSKPKDVEGVSGGRQWILPDRRTSLEVILPFQARKSYSRLWKMIWPVVSDDSLTTPTRVEGPPFKWKRCWSFKTIRWLGPKFWVQSDVSEVSGSYECRHRECRSILHPWPVLSSGF